VKKIQTALYLDPAVHGWATKRAAEDGRSLSQYIAKVLLDTSKVKPAIAAKVEWPKSDPWAAARPAARPAMPPPTSRDLFLLENWNLRMIDPMSIDDFRRRRDAGELKGYQEMLDELGDI